MEEKRENPDYIAIGKRIRNARKQIGLTQEKLAEKTRLSHSHMSHIETGTTKVSLPSLIAIANALNTTVDSLLHDNIKVTKEAFDKDMQDILSGCSVHERDTILNVAKSLRDSFSK